MSQKSEQSEGSDDPHPRTIGELAEMLPIEQWVPVPGFPGWRVKRLRNGKVITSCQ